MAAIPAIGLFLILAGTAADTALVVEYPFGDFRDASRVAAGSDGSLLVTDPGQQRVFLFRSPREEPASAGGYGWGSGSFDGPTGAVTDGVNVYVSDYGNHRIERFDRGMNFLSVLKTRDTSETGLRFGYPLGVALSGFGDLLILDGENQRLLKFNAGSRFDPSFADASINRRPLDHAVKVVATSTGVVIVGERGFLHILDQFGNEIHTVQDSILNEMRGFDSDGRSIVAVTEDEVIFYSPEGVRLGSTAASSIPGMEGGIHLRDAAFLASRLILLTPNRAFVVRVASE